MIRYLIRRLLWALILFIVVTIITYVIFFLIPNDIASAVAGKSATAAQKKQATHYLGLDKPVYVQYWKFLSRLSPIQFHSFPPFKTPSLGKSFLQAEDVNRIVGDAYPVTVSLVLGGAFFWMLIAVPIGILSALRPRSIMDRITMMFVLIGISAHPVWIGLIFSFVFGYQFQKWGLPHTPIAGYCNIINPPPGSTCGGPVQWAYHMLLPWITFAILFAALYVRMIRANVMETLSEDYVRTARAKGAPEHRVMISHVIRNAMLPVVTMLGMDIGLALGGAIFTETVYGLPGLGKIAIGAVQTSDLPIVMGVVVFGTVAIIVFNLLVDLLYAWIDPRIRLA